MTCPRSHESRLSPGGLIPQFLHYVLTSHLALTATGLRIFRIGEMSRFG